MLDCIDDTIVAPSSSPGYGPVGIVRVSGPSTFQIVSQIFDPGGQVDLVNTPGYTRIEGSIQLTPAATLPAFLYLFRRPRSYTRQDLIEIHTLGADPILELIRLRLIELGARPAMPGEFTARAYLAGGMSMAQAQAVARLIQARSDTQLRASRRLIDSDWTQDLIKVRDHLAEILALVEADIDFADQPIEFIRPQELVARLTDLQSLLDNLAKSSAAVERPQPLPHILLLGPPNAGKSTLLNRLTGTSRAICSTIAGTTRDLLSAPLKLAFGEAILLDAAGIDAAPDEVIAQARRLALRTAETVDLVCLVLDAAACLRDPHYLTAFLANLHGLDLPSSLVVCNKSDLLSPPDLDHLLRVLPSISRGPVIPISAHSGQGIQDLLNSLNETLPLHSATAGGDWIILAESQRLALHNARSALTRAQALAKSAAATIDQADLIAFELREAIDFLGIVAGHVPTEDLLNQIFSRFCIGK